MLAAPFSRQRQRRHGGSAQVFVEHPRLATADDVERTGNGIGGHRQSRSQCFEQHQAEGVGATWKNENVRRGVKSRQVAALALAEEVRLRMPALQLIAQWPIA